MCKKKHELNILSSICRHDGNMKMSECNAFWNYKKISLIWAIFKKTVKTEKQTQKPWETQREVTGEQIRARKKTPCNLPDYDMKDVSLLRVCTIFSISYKRPGKHIKAQALVVTFYFRWNTGLEKPDKCLCSWQIWSCIFILTFFSP